MATLSNFKICNNLDTCLDQLESNPRLAVAISREHAKRRRQAIALKIWK